MGRIITYIMENKTVWNHQPGMIMYGDLIVFFFGMMNVFSNDIQHRHPQKKYHNTS